MPCAFSYPAGLMTPPTDELTLETMCSGFHPSSAIFLMDWAANFGVEMLMKTSAPLALSLTMWSSIDGSEVS